MSDASLTGPLQSNSASRGRWAELARQVLCFLAVGGLGLLVDLAVFNTLRATVFSPAHVAAGALAAKSVSTVAAIATNWVGNRLVTFRSSRRERLAREAVEFLAASLLGSSVALVCLGVSHYLLGWTSALADNLSANVVGLGLGTSMRFALYRMWVFRDRSVARGV